jgi:hypothetical protein
VSLGSTFVSIDQLLKGNFLVIIFYIAGSVVGKYIGMNLEITPKKKNKRGFRVSEYFY